MTRCLLFLLVAASVILPATSGAATAKVDQGVMVFEAAPGELNDVSITSASFSNSETSDQSAQVTLRDGGAALVPGPGCAPGAPGEVVCSWTFFGWGFELARIKLRDGNDRFSAAGTCPAELDCFFDVAGGDGDDVLVGSQGPDQLRGGAGNDSLEGRAGEVLFFYIGFGDFLYGERGDDHLAGGAGRDLLDGGLGADVLQGGSGSDQVSYGQRRQPVFADLDGLPDDGEADEGDLVGTDVEELGGGSRSDRLTGNARRNGLFGGSGDDVLAGRGGPDWIIGGRGNDVVSGGEGSDSLVGGSVTERLDASPFEPGKARDLIFGGPGNDSLYAEERKPDRLDGGPGRDWASVDRGLDRVASIENVESFFLAGRALSN